MKFRESDSNKRKVKAAFDLTPLIDVMFQLSLFFMLSSTFVVQSSIQIEMPEAEGATTLEQKDLSITLAHGSGGPDDGGLIYMGDEKVATWEELGQRLLEESQRAPDAVPMLLIRSDGRVPMSRTVRVWGLATSVGFTKFGVAAQPLEEEG
jgi:biopolymer transport protein ExbD